MHLNAHFGGHRSLSKLLLIMNFTAIIFLATCLQVSALGHSQTITLSENNASLEKIFRELKRQTVYDFWYESKLLKNAKKVNIQVKNASIEEVLTACFKNQLLSYSIVEKTIIVKPVIPQVETAKSPPPWPEPLTPSWVITDLLSPPLCTIHRESRSTEGETSTLPMLLTRASAS